MHKQGLASVERKLPKVFCESVKTLSHKQRSLSVSEDHLQLLPVQVTDTVGIETKHQTIAAPKYVFQCFLSFYFFMHPSRQIFKRTMKFLNVKSQNEYLIAKCFSHYECISVYLSETVSVLVHQSQAEILKNEQFLLFNLCLVSAEFPDSVVTTNANMYT